MKAWSGIKYICTGDARSTQVEKNLQKHKPTTLSLYRSVRIMIHRQRHKKGIPEFCWRGCPVKVHKTFTGHPLFGEKCCTAACDEERCHLAYSYISSAFCAEAPEYHPAFVQSAESHKNEKNQFLIGKDFSYLTLILPDMESAAGGELG